MRKSIAWYNVGKAISLAVIILTSGCSSLSGKNGKITFKDEVVVYEEGQPRTVAAGTEVTIGSSPIFVEKRGHLPIVVLPLENNSRSVEISLKKASNDTISMALADENMRFLNNIMEQTAVIERYLATGRLADAQAKIEILLTQYPDFHFLKLLKASHEMMAGRRDQAKLLVEQVLKTNPNGQLANEFYSILEPGHKWIGQDKVTSPGETP